MLIYCLKINSLAFIIPVAILSCLGKIKLSKSQILIITFISIFQEYRFLRIRHYLSCGNRALKINWRKKMPVFLICMNYLFRRLLNNRILLNFYFLDKFRLVFCLKNPRYLIILINIFSWTSNIINTLNIKSMVPSPILSNTHWHIPLIIQECLNHKFLIKIIIPTCDFIYLFV